MSLEVHLLGPVTVVADGGVVALPSATQRTLIALLAADADSRVSARSLMDRIWGTTPPVSARNNLQVQISGLRKALSERCDRPLVVTESAGYRLCVTADAVDALRLTVSSVLAEGSRPPVTCRQLHRCCAKRWPSGVPSHSSTSCRLRGGNSNYGNSI